MSLSALELAQMQADADDYMPDTCVIYDPTVTIDAMGGQSMSWTAAATVPCRLAPLSGLGEVINGAQITSVTSWVLTIAHDRAIDATERVATGGDTYQVESVEDQHSNRTARRVYMTRLN